MADRRSFLPASSAGGSLSATEPSYRDNLAALLAQAGRALGMDNYRATDVGKRITGLAEFSPLGLLTSYDDAQRAAESGDIPGMALGALGAVPVAGKAGKAAAKAAELADLRKATDALFREGVTPSVPQHDIPRYEPARGVPGRVADVVKNPQVRQGMLEAIERGKSLGGQNWYNMEPLRLAFVDELGAEGTPRFNRFQDYVAGSSPRSSPEENFRNASFYYGLDVNGRPLPEPYVTEAGKRIANPEPYGHIAQNLHRMNFEKIRGGTGLDYRRNPKPLGFSEDLKGNLQPVAVDTHAFRLPAILSQDPRFLEKNLQPAKKGDPARNIFKEFERGDVSMEEALQRPAYWATQPEENEYLAMERFYQSLAPEAGLTPGETQAAAWVGGGPMTGLRADETQTAMDLFKRRVALTSQKLQQDPRDVLAKMIRGQQGLLGLGGLALGTEMLTRPEDRNGGRP